MILKENEQVNIIDGDSFGVVTKSKINDTKLSKLFSVLSGLYKNVPESIVREYCSNAWDSHKEANKEDVPIIIKLEDNGDDSVLIIQDKGLGMSPEVMNNVYFNYLDSTKECSNDVLGGFGLGSKSALAYTHTIFIETIWNNMKYNYMFYKSSNGIPAHELITSEETSDCNGVKVTIPIKSKDITVFHNAIKNQLIYFPNVYVDSPYNFDNSFKLYEFDSFICRPDMPYSNMHMCLGNVYYPIDWEELKISPIKIPVALKFAIGELMPVPSREDIVYSIDSIKIIKDKIKEVTDFLTDKFNEKAIEVETIAEYDKYYDKYFNGIQLSDDLFLRIDKSILKDKKLFSGLKFPSIKGSNKYLSSNLIYELRYIGYCLYGKEIRDNGNKANMSASKIYSWDLNNKFKAIDAYALPDYYPSLYAIRYDKDELFILDSESSMSNVKNNYIVGSENHYSYKTVRFLKKRELSLDTYKNIFLKSIPKSEWRNTLTTLFKLVDEYVTSSFSRYEDIIVPEQWELYFKEKAKLQRQTYIDNTARLKDEVCYEWLERDYSHGYVWRKATDTVKTIQGLAKNIIYFKPNDRLNAKDLHSLLNDINFNGKRNIFKVISIAPMHSKKFTNNKCISYEDFIYKPSNILSKLATAYIIKSRIERVDDIYTSSSFRRINDYYFKLAIELDKYLDKYHKNYSSKYTVISNIIKTSAEKLGIIDNYMIDKLNAFEGIKCKVSRINSLFQLKPYDGKDYKYYEYLKTLFKLENLEVNKYFYLKKEFNPLLNNNLWNN